MITIRCLASGSSGNSYAIDDGKTVLLLEAGISAKKIASGYLDLYPRICGCLITHEHGDHARGAMDLSKRGIDIYASEGTLTTIGNVHSRPYKLKAYKKITAGSWTVLPFEAKHDAAEPLGFLIQSNATKDNLIFATDTYYIPNTFRDLNYIMIECNYSEDLAKANETAYPGMLQRLRISHFGLENVLEMLSANDLSRVYHIYLMHVSSRNGNKDRFKKAVQEATGLPVTVF